MRLFGPSVQIERHRLDQAQAALEGLVGALFHTLRMLSPACFRGQNTRGCPEKGGASQ
jgi:hypothetical protein